MKRAALALALLAAAALAAYLAWPPAREAPPAPARAAARAHVAAQGKVEAMPGYDVNVGSGELNGKVESILVAQGETVRAGQVVAILENAREQASVREAQARLAVARGQLAEVRAGARAEEIAEARAARAGAQAAATEAASQLDRHRELHAKGMVSQASLDERQRAAAMARSALEQSEQRLRLLEAGARAETVGVREAEVRLAEAALEHARRVLERTYIRAPISGTVIERHVDAGSGVTPEIPIVAIADLGRLWLNVEVDETDVGHVRIGSPVEVTSDAYRGTVFRGRVRQVADYAGVRRVRPSNPAVNLALRVVQVKIELLEPTPLRLGMTVDAKIAAGAGAAP